MNEVPRVPRVPTTEHQGVEVCGDRSHPPVLVVDPITTHVKETVGTYILQMDMYSTM